MTEILDTPPSSTSPKRRSVLRRVVLAGAFAASFLAGGLILSSPPAEAFTMAMEQAGMPMMHDPARMHEMAQAHIDKMLTAVDATADQKARIKTILHHGFDSVGPMHEKMASIHGDLHKILSAPIIDRAALEQLRAEHMADFDQASKVMVQTIADAAEVLTPEQRAKLATLMAGGHRDHS